ncbi:hypothetical protein FY528_13355 [Hymenobacter lutimineralis]|uniref:Glycosyltransferase RgtA/B/C/D-like domain-containing protein n=1 Tax=Hymenobacter lutimineralis TaxID=2606448 RepID=A0A5D6UZF2_9BACT|nr:hypothetical protein [Hymenobacter lutimineralis]TYZ08032.1 hypothetical protein FY528_13355 [Hymenobacter lutimineralis]
MPSFRQQLAEGSRSLPLGLFALCLLLVSGSLALLYGFTSPADFQTLRHALYAQNDVPGFVLHVEASRYRVFIAGLTSCFLLGAVATYYEVRRRPGDYTMRAFWWDARRLLGSLLKTWRALSGLEWGLSGALLLNIVAVRLYYALAYPLGTDEVATYDYFVRGGALASTSFYPFPNNHVLFSLSCWLVSCFSDNAALVLRLPAFLISLVGTVLLFLLLLRFAGFRVAFLVVGLVSFSPMALYYAVAGRGYFLLLTLSVV